MILDVISKCQSKYMCAPQDDHKIYMLSLIQSTPLFYVYVYCTSPLLCAFFSQVGLYAICTTFPAAPLELSFQAPAGMGSKPAIGILGWYPKVCKHLLPTIHGDHAFWRQLLCIPGTLAHCHFIFMPVLAPAAKSASAMLCESMTYLLLFPIAGELVELPIVAVNGLS